MWAAKIRYTADHPVYQIFELTKTMTTMLQFAYFICTSMSPLHHASPGR